MPISRLLAILGVLGALAFATPAWAIDETAARQHFERATDAFSKGRYDEAVREYLLAYRASNDPSLLFNVAQSHRLGGHYSSALQYYRMYLQNTPDAPDRKEVERQIHEMEKKLGAQAGPPEKLAPPPLKPVTPEPSAAPPPKLIVPTPPEPPVAPPPSSTEPATPPHIDARSPYPQEQQGSPFAGRAKIIGGAVTLAAGVALVATGIAFGALAQSAGDQLTADNRAGKPFDPAKQSEGQHDTIAEGVCLGIGAAAAIAGAVVLGLGITEKRAARVAVVPVISPTGAAASMSVRF